MNDHSLKCGYCINVYSRLCNSTFTIPGFLFALYDKSKYGQLYASKEKLWLLNKAFLTPKASPLKARF